MRGYGHAWKFGRSGFGGLSMSAKRFKAQKRKKKVTKTHSQTTTEAAINTWTNSAIKSRTNPTIHETSGASIEIPTTSTIKTTTTTKNKTTINETSGASTKTSTINDQNPDAQRNISSVDQNPHNHQQIVRNLAKTPTLNEMSESSTKTPALRKTSEASTKPTTTISETSEASTETTTNSTINEHATMNSPIMNLPIDVLTHILEWFDYATALSARTACRLFRDTLRVEHRFRSNWVDGMRRAENESSAHSGLFACPGCLRFRPEADFLPGDLVGEMDLAEYEFTYEVEFHDRLCNWCDGTV